MEITLPPIWNSFEKLVALANKELYLITPWIKIEMIERLRRILGERKIVVKVLTRGNNRDFYDESSDIGAFRELNELNASIKLINDLHAKVYIADNKFALISSANLTNSGMQSLGEIGVMISDPDQMEKLNETVEKWFIEGESLDLSWLNQIAKELEEKKAELSNIGKQERTILSGLVECKRGCFKHPSEKLARKLEKNTQNLTFNIQIEDEHILKDASQADPKTAIASEIQNFNVNLVDFTSQYQGVDGGLEKYGIKKLTAMIPKELQIGNLSLNETKTKHKAMLMASLITLNKISDTEFSYSLPSGVSGSVELLKESSLLHKGEFGSPSISMSINTGFAKKAQSSGYPGVFSIIGGLVCRYLLTGNKKPYLKDRNRKKALTFDFMSY